MAKLFGTDGVRGIANTDLTCELALSLGRSFGSTLQAGAEKPVVVIGKDTRLSSDMLEGAISAGLCSVGINVLQVGVVPTPAVPFLVNSEKACAGIMISASHNSYEYNGIKIFNADGYKLSDETEDKIEELVNLNVFEKTAYDETGVITCDKQLVLKYISHLVKCTPKSLSGLKLAIDCANGSACATAKQIFEELGAQCEMLFDTPNGVNINDNCGSTHMGSLAKFVKDNNCFAGIAFDGDADRFLAVDEDGNYIDGDQIIAAISIHLKNKNMLKNGTAVVTVMSNLGLMHCFKANDINCEATKVGDRYVLEKMISGGYNLGGEQSGHVIFSDYATTGDGQLTALQLLSVCVENGVSLKTAVSVMEKFPQILIGVEADNEAKEKYENNAELKNAIEEMQSKLGNRGRILVRPSGTEPLIRVMVEGKDVSETEKIAKEISVLINKVIR